MHSESYKILLLEYESQAEQLLLSFQKHYPDDSIELVYSIGELGEVLKVSEYDLLILDRGLIYETADFESIRDIPVLLAEWSEHRLYLRLDDIETHFLEGISIDQLPQLSHQLVERHRLKKLFSESQARMGFQALLLDRVRDVIIGVDMDADIVYWNHGAEVVLGYNSEEVLGKPVSMFFPEVAQDPEWFSDLLKRLQAGNLLQEWLATGREHKWLSVCAQQVKSSKGMGVLFVAQDITENRRLLLQASQQAEHTSIINRVLTVVAKSNSLDEMLTMLTFLLADVFKTTGVTIDSLEPHRGLRRRASVGACQSEILDAEMLELQLSVTEEKVKVVAPYRNGECGIICLKVSQSVWMISLWTSSRQWTERDIELLCEIGTIVSVSIEKASLYETARASAERERLINHFTQAISSSLDLDKIIQTICDEIAKSLDVSRCYFNKIYAHTLSSVIAYEHCKPDIPTLKGAVFDHRQFGNQAVLLSKGTTLIIRSSREEDRQTPIYKLAEQLGVLSLMVVPVLVDGKIIGTISLNQCDYDRAWTTDETILVEALAKQCSVALRNARLYSETRSLELRYRTLFENASDAILIVDLVSSRIVDANSKAEVLTGYVRAQLLEIDMSQLIEDLAAYNNIYHELGRLKSVRIDNLRLRRNDSTYLQVELTASLLGVDDATVIQVLLRDLTEQRKLEKQLINTQRLESLGSLTGGIAHDFNNILAGILGYAELLRKKLDPDNVKLQNYAGVIEQSAKRGSELAKRLVAFARGSSLSFEGVDLNIVVSETIQLLSPALGRSIDVQTELATNLLPIEANASQMQQVLMNLCLNARDAMKDGGTIRISTCNRSLSFDESGSADYVQLTVEDTGCGMDEKTLARIFEPFFTTKEEGKGTGLGLAMVSVIIRESKGRIEVKSTPGKGTRFDVFLPVSYRLLEKQAEQMRQSLFGQETILVVDDEEPLRLLAKDMLENFGYKVITVSNGFEAIETYRERASEIALVILDMIMPGMDGRDLFYEIRRLDPAASIIIASGYCPAQVVEELSDAGVDGIISKPYQSEDMASEIRRIINRKKSHTV